jgi:GDPmannose 4,6-dehydratase
METAIIVGCLGQDGRILYDYLIGNDYKVIGIDVNYHQSSFDDRKDVINISDKEHVNHLVRTTSPSKIYYLAAFHHSAEDKTYISNSELLHNSFNINVESLVYFLESILEYSPHTKLFYASSSHIFGDNEREYDDEESHINPVSIYGISKAAGLFACRYYRNNYSLFISCGIFYNHESTYRTKNYLSKKIIRGAININNNIQDTLVLGDLSAAVDWGYAPDYVDAMYKILNLDKPNDYIISTGIKHTVSDFARIAFQHLGIDSKHFLKEQKSILSKPPVCRIGNSDKLKKDTSWEPSVDFSQMIKLLLIAEDDC